MQGIRIFPNFHTTNLVVVNCRFAIRSFFFTSLFALRKLTILVYNWNKICTSNHKLWCTHVEILWEDELWWKCDTSINIGLEFAILKKRHLHKMFRLIMNAKEKEKGRHSLTRWAIASKCFMFFLFHCSHLLERIMPVFCIGHFPWFFSISSSTSALEHYWTPVKVPLCMCT